MAIGKKKAAVNVLLTIAAVVFTICGPVIGALAANGWNEWTSGGSLDYDQQENATAYLSAPFVEEKISTEGRYASINGTGTSANITAETPVFDVVTEWDQVTITSTGTDVRFILNLNLSLAEMMASKYTELRIKTNSSKALDIEIEAVKSDGVDLTTYDLYEAEPGNLSKTSTWSFDATDILLAKTTLAPAKTDDVWIRIIISGKDTVKLTTADVIQFQVALGGNDNVYAIAHEDSLGLTAVILGIVYLVGGTLATPWINFSGDGSLQKTVSTAARGRKSKSRRGSRGSMGIVPVLVLGGLAVVLGVFSMDAAAAPTTSTVNAGSTIDPLFWGIAGSFVFIGAFAFMMFSGVTKTLPKKFNLLGMTISTTTGVVGSFIATATDTSTFVSAAFLGQLGWQGWVFAAGFAWFVIVLIWNGIYCWRMKKPFSLVR